MVLTRDMEDRVILDVMDDIFFTLGKIPGKFCVDIFMYIFMGSVTGRGVLGGC